MFRKILKKVKSFNLACILSEDAKYKLWFFMSYLPDLYRRHTRKNFKNCLFCSSLIKSGCHRYCLKCGAGTYIQCSPPLPGLLYEVTVHMVREDVLPDPWYFKKTCSSFKRLPLYKYGHNLYSVFPSIALNNYEALEGLERGLSSGARPCYICASVDYSFYKECTRQPEYDASVSCMKIVNELKKVYENQSRYSGYAKRQKVTKSAV